MKLEPIEPYRIKTPPGFERVFPRDWLLTLDYSSSISLEWIRKSVSRHPPVVCKIQNSFVLISGLRSYLLMVKAFPDEKIPVAIEKGECIDPLRELIQSEFINLYLIHPGNPKGPARHLERLWLSLNSEQWQSLSEELKSKSGFGRLTGLNRRTIAQPVPEAPRSEFGKFSR